MKIIQYIFFFVIAYTLMVLPTGCRKDVLLSDGQLQFSADTVLFDTVFTTVGSTTKRFKIYNTSNRPVIISQVRLAGGTSSNFRFNLDGVSGTQFNDIRIPGNDSLFAFVEVTLDPNNQNLPLIVEDSIIFSTNNKEQRVLLAAWGQDAYFHYMDLNEGLWPNDKPHVIYNFALVDSAKTLTIQAGTQIHLHKNSLLFIRKGSLQVEGTVNNKVVFQGDRLEPFYQDVKGQYYGLYFAEARPSKIDHAIIKNGTAGIHVFSRTDPIATTLEITNSEIYNHASYGIFNYDRGNIYGENLLVHSNNFYSFFQLEGGNYDFRHCHFLGFGTDGNQPAIAIRNYFTRNDGITYIGEIGLGNIYNSVIYGSGFNQIAYDTLNQNGAVQINYDFQSNLIRQENAVELQTLSGFANNFWNTDPKFLSLEEDDFRFESTSILNNNGNSSFATNSDILGKPRNMATPDIGAFEID